MYVYMYVYIIYVFDVRALVKKNRLESERMRNSPPERGRWNAMGGLFWRDPRLSESPSFDARTEVNPTSVPRKVQGPLPMPPLPHSSNLSKSSSPPHPPKEWFGPRRMVSVHCFFFQYTMRLFCRRYILGFLIPSSLDFCFFGTLESLRKFRGSRPRA